MEPMRTHTGLRGAWPAIRGLGATLPLGAAVLLLALPGCGEGGAERPGRPTVGSPAPEYSARTLEGSTLALSDLEGQVVLLNVWATWCGPCVREMPGLEALHRTYGDRGLSVVGASIDRGSAEATVRRFIETHGITFSIVLDPDETVTSRFWTIGVPETFLLDRDGTIRHRWIGEFDPGAPEVRERLEALLDGAHS